MRINKIRGADQRSDIDARVEGEYPAASSQRSCGERGPSRIRYPQARSTSGYGSKLLSAFCSHKPPGQHDRKRDFVKLDAPPVGLAIDPEILIEAAILALRNG